MILRFRSTPNEATAKPGVGSNQAMALIVVIIIAIAAIAGFAILHKPKGMAQISCLTVTNHGNDIDVTTSGLIHYTGTQYYVSCNEGSAFPTSTDTDMCLTITPHQQTSSYPGAASNYYYYLSTKTGTITIQGVTSSTTSSTSTSATTSTTSSTSTTSTTSTTTSNNSTEIIQPTSATIVVAC